MLHAPEFISKLKRNKVFVCGKKTTYKSETIPNNKLFRRAL